MTNADRIRSMNNKELADFLKDVATGFSEMCESGEQYCNWPDFNELPYTCKDCFEKWLESDTN